jgi:hypothetical protein
MLPTSHFPGTEPAGALASAAGPPRLPEWNASLLRHGVVVSAAVRGSSGGRQTPIPAVDAPP